jgi:hypothetical protein
MLLKINKLINYNMDTNAPKNFYAMAKIPISTQESIHKYPCVNEGTCMINIDGNPISGGTLITGTSGYELSSMGFKGTSSLQQKNCAAFPLFFSTNARYMPGGDIVANNLKPLYAMYPKL